jgi:putative transposase
MENHFHAIVYSPVLSLSRVMADLKKFTTRRILAALKAEHQDWLLDLLAAAKAAHKKASRTQVWQEGYHPQAVYTDKVMLQKLAYLHNNPVRRGWVAAPEHWRYSSAHEWLPGALPLLRCDPWR